MKTVPLVVAGTIVFSVGLAGLTRSEQGAPSPPTVQSENALMRQYCLGCHNDTSRAAGLTLAAFDVGRAEQHRETTEKIIRKLRAGMMPPAGNRRPSLETTRTLAASLE